jgi:hypothetical protein
MDGLFFGVWIVFRAACRMDAGSDEDAQMRAPAGCAGRLRCGSRDSASGQVSAVKRHRPGPEKDEARRRSELSVTYFIGRNARDELPLSGQLGWLIST